MFVTEMFSIDVTAMILLTILFTLGYLTPAEALSGFSNPAVITIAFLFIISKALQKTRILEYLIIRVRRLADRSILLGRAVYLFTIGIASAVVNNTAIVAIFMPVSIRLAQKYKMSPSKMLIPLSYAAILGGTLTLVGTSTNLLVNSIYIETPGVEPMGMFEFMRYGLILMAVGLLYILFIAPMILPSRTSTSSLTKSYRLGGYLTEMKITAESPLNGKTCLERGINKNYDVMVLDILRDDKMITNMIRLTRLREGDILFVRGTLENFLRMKEVEKVALLTDEKLTQEELEQEDNVVVECLITDKSDMVGKSLMTSNFRRRFGAFILAIRREGTIVREKIAHVILSAYDTLLIYGPENKINELSKTSEFVVLGEVDAELKKQRFWWMTIVVIIGTITLAALGLMPIVKSAMLGVVILLALRILTPQESYQSINWQVIILISALIPVGIVIQKTGTADWIAGFISSATRSVPIEWQPRVLLALIYFITIFLTEISSNAATAIIMTPISLAVAQQMGFDPRAFVFAVAFAASASFITPVGYQTNLMVYGPGGYKFSDYIRVGFPLALIFWVMAIFVLPILWPI
ncbi:MAG: SLC13 family permease [Candidatus Neomarinimicrobiota bacterium]